MVFSTDTGELVRKMALFFDNQIQDCSKQEGELIYNSLFDKIKSLNAPFNIIECDDLSVNSENKKKNYLSKVNSDSWLDIKITGSMEDLRIYWNFYDVIKDKIVYENSYNGFIDYKYRNLRGGFWSPVIKSLASAMIYFGETTLVNVKALPDSVIYGFPNEKFVVPESGELSVQVISYSSLTLTAVKDGYAPDEVKIIAVDGVDDVVFKQVRDYGFSFELGLSDLSYPHFGFKYDILQDQVYIGFSFDFYQFGVFPPSFYLPYQPLSIFPDLWTINLNLGYIFSFPQFRIGVPLELSSSIRLYSKDGNTSADKLIPLSIDIKTGLLVRIHRNVSFYLKPKFIFYFYGSDKYTYVADSFNSSNWDSFAIAIFENVAIDPLGLDLGLSFNF